MRLRGTKTSVISTNGGLGDQLWDLGGARPSLDLNFAHSKDLTDATTGSNLVDFTRASSGTYVGSDGLIKTATTNEPRFDHDPTTGESLGLLVEESRTNLLLRSEEFDNAAWTTNAVNGSASPAIGIAAPDGTDTAYIVTSTAANGIIRQDATSASATTYTWSCFVKKKTSPKIEISVVRVGGTAYSANLTYNFDTDTVSLVSDDYGNSPYGRQLLPNGWVRLYATVTDQGSNTQARMYLRPSSTGASDMYAWGAQLEVGSFPTSYIPTEGSTVTRAADVASISGSNYSGWARQDECTVFAAATEYPFVSTTSRVFWSLVNSGSVNTDFIRQWIWSGNTSLLALSVYTSSSGPVAADFSSALSSGEKKLAVAVAANNFARSLNGGEVSVDSVGNMPNGIDILTIGQATGAGLPLNGHLRRLTYWPQRLPNETLQTITQ